MRAMPGYARRYGTYGDVRTLGAVYVTGTRWADGMPFRWRRDKCELFEFASFNPESANYQRGGKPWVSDTAEPVTPQRAVEVAEPDRDDLDAMGHE